MGNAFVTHFFSYYTYTRMHSDMALVHSNNIYKILSIIKPLKS